GVGPPANSSILPICREGVKGGEAAGLLPPRKLVPIKEDVLVIPVALSTPFPLAVRRPGRGPRRTPSPAGATPPPARRRRRPRCWGGPAGRRPGPRGGTARPPRGAA